MFRFSSFKHVSVCPSMWLAEMLRWLVTWVYRSYCISGEARQTLPESWRVHSESSIKCCCVPIQRPTPLVTASTREVLQQITWLAIFQIKLVLIWMLSKKYLRPGEDYSVYKSKAAASICNGTFFFFLNPDLTILLSELSSLQLWKPGKTLKHKAQVPSWTF